VKCLSNYISLAISLLVVLALTQVFAENITSVVENTVKSVEEQDILVCVDYRVAGSVKYVVVDKQCAGRVVAAHGYYSIVANTTRLLILETRSSERVVVIAESGVYVV